MTSQPSGISEAAGGMDGYKVPPPTLLVPVIRKFHRNGNILLPKRQPPAWVTHLCLHTQKERGGRLLLSSILPRCLFPTTRFLVPLCVTLLEVTRSLAPLPSLGDSCSSNTLLSRNHSEAFRITVPAAVRCLGVIPSVGTWVLLRRSRRILRHGERPHPITSNFSEPSGC